MDPMSNDEANKLSKAVEPGRRPWWQGVTRQQWYALGAGQIGYALDAFDVMLYAFAIPTIMKEWELSRGAAGFMISVTLFFSSIGGIAFGVVADRFGRKRAMMATVLLFSACSGLSGLAQNLTQLALARAVLGLGMGGEWTAGALLIAETWPDHHRGKAIGFMQSGWAIGYIGAAIAAATVLPAFGWRVLFFLGIAPALFTLWLRARLEEPEIWVTHHRAQPMRVRENIVQLFRRDLLRSTLSATLVAALVMFAYWGVFTWIPDYLADVVGLSMVKAPVYTIPMMIGAFFGYVSFGFVSDRFGRRSTFAAYLLIAGMLVFVFASVRTSTGLLAVGPLLGFFGSGYFSAFGAILSEIFPTRARGVGVGFSYNTGRMLSAAAPTVVGFVSAQYKFVVAFALIAATFVAAAAAGIFLLPETRGRHLI